MSSFSDPGGFGKERSEGASIDRETVAPVDSPPDKAFRVLHGNLLLLPQRMDVSGVK